jgi:uncharacterized Zn finger protein
VLRLDVLVAVRLDREVLLASVGHELSELGQGHLAQGRVGDLETEDGGASAAVSDPGCGLLPVWVGVVNGVLTGECDCADGVSGRLCGHAVAVALAALDAGLTFSSVLARGQDGAGPEERRFAEIAAGLAPGTLIGLVARQAAADRYFAALLLSCAGQLTPPGVEELREARLSVEAAEAVPTSRYWELGDIVDAGRAMVAELQLLAVRPPSDELLAVVEEAIIVWAALACHLRDARSAYEAEDEEVGSALAELHLQLCEACLPSPIELAARLAKLVADPDVNMVLDVPGDYADVLGPEGMAAFNALLQRNGA